MPICDGCGASFDDSFKYCTFCGKVKKREDKIDGEKSSCPSCGYLNPTFVKFCQKCGNKLIQRCRQCNAQNPLAVQYCGNCGIKLSDAIFTLSADDAEKWRNKFWEHLGVKEYYAQGGYCEITFFPISNKIDEYLKLPFPVTFGEEKVCLSIPIVNRRWCIDSVKHQGEEITFGLWQILRNKVLLYAFQKNSRKYFLYGDLNSVESSNDDLILNFEKGGKLELHLQIPKTSQAKANIFRVAEVFGGILGAAASDALYEKSETERRLEEIRSEVHNARQMSSSEIADQEYQIENIAVQTYMTLMKSFFEDVIRKKNLLEKNY